ncbi:hypothetical protein LCGC14_1759180, partial [marine sediment metagenome]
KVEDNGRKINVIEHQVNDMEPRVEEAIAHKHQSETDMKWMKKTVEDYNKKQEALIAEIRNLKK